MIVMPTHRPGLLVLVTVGLLTGGSLPNVAANPLVEVRLELTAGEPVCGELLAVDADAIRIRVDGQPRSFLVREVRRVVSEKAAPEARSVVRVVTCAGGQLAGADFMQTAEQCVIVQAGGQIEIPADRIAHVAWLGENESEPAWLAAAPARPAADLVVVRQADGHTFVECAISAVNTDSVTVVLDGETIPVKRTKVAGIVWLREPTPPPTGPVVTVAGGRLAAERIRWSPEEFVLDDVVRLPPATLRSIDYTSGRTLPLAATEPEQVTNEPAFGSLATIDGLADFFAPRIIPPADRDGPAAMILRPRTVMTWRVPPDARRFRARLTRDVVETAPATVEVRVAVDGREAFRQLLSGASDRDVESSVAAAIDLDVSAGRRLTVEVDFVGSDLGCPIRLTDAVFER